MQNWLDKVKGFREIAVFALLGIYGIALLRTLFGLIDDKSNGYGGWEFTDRAYFSYSNLFQPLAAVLIVVLVAWIAADAAKARKANQLALISLIVVGACTALGLLFGLIGLGSSALEGLGVVTQLFNLISYVVIPGLACAGLFFVFSGTKQAPNYQAQNYNPGAPQQQGWQQDPNAGGAWGSAGQAASGASASEWGGQQQAGNAWGQQSAQSAPMPPQSAMSATEWTPVEGQQGYGQDQQGYGQDQQGYGQQNPQQGGWQQ